MKKHYPFGLAMADISDKALKPNYAENKYRYKGGTELQNKEFSDGSGLELYDANARMYDPQIGRFGGIDELSGTTMGLSPYSFGFNNPVLFSLGVSYSDRSGVTGGDATFTIGQFLSIPLGNPFPIPFIP